MIQFQTLQDALDYRRSCPMCASYLEMDNREVDLVTECAYGDHKRTILTWSRSESKLQIDLETGALVAYTETRSMNPIYGIGSASPLSYNPATWNTSIRTDGHMMERLLIGCERCYQYDYVIQVIVSIKESRITGLVLNSESLTIDEGNATHEIRNVYSFEKTEYNKFINKSDNTHKLHNYVGNDTVSLPLIPLDLERPYKTLERIKTLVLFS